jgi:hypothetical protein
MDSLKHALRLNNEGVRLLLANKDHESVSCFTQSLNLVKHALSTTHSDQQQHHAPSVAFIHGSTHSIPNLYDTSCFIFGDAITLAEDNDLLLQRSGEQDVHVYSAVIILNIAMAYHRQALLTGSAACRFKAEKMYDMVTTLVANSEDNQGTSLLVKIAAINNLSQLRFDEGDYEASREGFEYLGALINYAETHLSSSLTSQEDTFQGMVLNVLLVMAPEIAAAA